MLMTTRVSDVARLRKTFESAGACRQRLSYRVVLMYSVRGLERNKKNGREVRDRRVKRSLDGSVRIDISCVRGRRYALPLLHPVATD
jgi:hypothetical protein